MNRRTFLRSLGLGALFAPAAVKAITREPLPSARPAAAPIGRSDFDTGLGPRYKVRIRAFLLSNMLENPEATTDLELSHMEMRSFKMNDSIQGIVLCDCGNCSVTLTEASGRCAMATVEHL